MPLVTTFLYEPTMRQIRYDVINGVQTGPFNENFIGPLSRIKIQKDRNDTPNFGRYVREHLWKPQNAYILDKEDAQMPQGYPFLKLIWIPTGDYSTYHGPDSTGYSSVTYLQPTIAERDLFFNNLYAKVLLKVKDQKVNLGVFAAERHKTIQMIGDTVGRIARAFRAVKRGRFSDAFNYLACGPSKRVNRFQDAANNWLQLQYGWRPLLSDVYGVSEELSRSFDRFIGHAPIQTQRSQYIWDKEDQILSGLPILMTAERGAIYRARVWVSYTADLQSSQFLGRIGLTNPLEIAWEVVPYSFVVDWFLPVGRFLSTLDATLGCTFVNGGTSGLLLSEITTDRKGSYIAGNFRYEYDRKSSRAKLARYERGALSSFPAVTLPQLKNPVSQLHCANALALLTQVFSRK